MQRFRSVVLTVTSVFDTANLHTQNIQEPLCKGKYYFCRNSFVSQQQTIADVLHYQIIRGPPCLTKRLFGKTNTH